jgi:hypothetical protein
MGKVKEYYIQNGFIGNAAAWWAVDRKGYTTDLRKAGRYTHEEAKEIVQRPQDRAWPCSYIDGHTGAQKLIVDVQYLDRSRALIGKTK